MEMSSVHHIYWQAYAFLFYETRNRLHIEPEAAKVNSTHCAPHSPGPVNNSQKSYVQTKAHNSLNEARAGGQASE